MNKFIALVRKHLPHYALTDDEIAEVILQHMRYNTFDYIQKRGEVVAMVRYNIINDGRVADILDLIIDPKENGLKVMRYFAANGWMRFPSIRFIRFERIYKYEGRQHRMYRIADFFKRGNK